MCRKELFVVGAAIVMVTAVVMFFPITGTAGSPNPLSPPILNEVLKKLDNIQGQLDNIPPAWSQKLPAEQRFVLVFDGEAVLDKETGLVWERFVNPTAVTFSWYDAFYICANLDLGGRKGWHLPSIEQLASLVDKSAPDGSPQLPPGHPFTIIMQGLGGYWSATSYAVDSTSALIMGFNQGNVVIQNKNLLRQVWCVRSGQSYDGH